MSEPRISLPCGSTASFDHGSGYGYRCDGCNAVVGSVGMPKRCADLLKDKPTPETNEEERI